MRAYQFPVPRKSKRNPPNAVSLQKEYPQEKPGLIQGIETQSLEEWRVAVALTKYKIPFEYQVPLFGGRTLRMGQVVDFVVINPFPTPLQVFGEYWHPDELRHEERLKLIIIAAYYNRPPVIFWGSELQTQEQADQKVRQEFL